MKHTPAQKQLTPQPSKPASKRKNTTNLNNQQKKSNQQNHY
jgi:hypothetical protein